MKLNVRLISETTKLGSKRIMESFIEQLKNVGFIEFKGKSTQTGGYYTIEKLIR